MGRAEQEIMQNEYVLAFDTANEVISLAVGRLNAAAQSVVLVAARQVEAHRASNTQLLPNVDSLLEECGVAREQLACIACGRGPGSFTGVRICIATAKGIASALEVPLVGVSTLDALAWELQTADVRGRVLVVAEAMRKEVYPQVYEITDRAIGRTSADTVVKADSFRNEEDAPLGGASATRQSGLGCADPDASSRSPKQYKTSQRACFPCAPAPHCIEQNASRLDEVSVQTVASPLSDASQSADEYTLVAGDALVKYADIFEPLGPLAPETQWRLKGAGLLAALQDAWRKGECDPFDANRHDPALLLPVYTRLSDAEEHEREKLAAPAPRDLHTGVGMAEEHVPLGGASAARQSGLGCADPDASSRSPKQYKTSQRACFPCASAPHCIKQNASRLEEVSVSKPPSGTPSSTITYRPLAAADIDQAVALEAVCMGTDAWNAVQFADELGRKDRTWWVACDNQNMVVAYAGGQVIDGQLQVFKVACSPDERRRGIAQELLARVASDARDLGATEATLEVRASNKDAKAFYEALGLASVGVRPHYYSDGEDALIMAGSLPIAAKDIAGMRLISGQAVLQDDGLAGCVSAEGFETPFLNNREAISFKCSEDPERPRAHARAAEGPSGEMPPASPAPPSPRILAIESSCDETAAAVIDGSGAILADTVASQIDFHARFGGVVPEIASRKHIEAICGVAQVCLEQAGVAHYRDLDTIACTYAPGLVGALVVGVAFAKGAAWGANIPYIQVNHLEGHLYANKLVRPDIAPPMVASLVSGGHTMLVHVRDWGNYEILGSTIDDAVGEAFDKVAKALGLGYPGGPIISRYAEVGNPQAIDFPRAMLHSHDLRFSLSGLKTAVVTYINKERQAERELNIPDIAASFQAAVIDVQIAKARTALEQTGAKEFCLGGGVAANPALRAAYETLCDEMGARLTLPPASACTDNAAMIACVALDRFSQGKFSPLDSDAFAHTNLEDSY